MIAAFFATVGAAGVSSATPAGAPVSHAEAARAIERLDAIAVGPLEAFERGRSDEDGRRCLAAALRARDLLESVRFSGEDSTARREELGFFNHLVLGFSAYLESPRGVSARRALAGIVARGRAHRQRAREALRRRR